MSRLLGIDYGKKRIGLALSDPLGMFASGLTTLENTRPKALIKALEEVVQAHEVSLIVMGLPLKTTGEKGESAEAAEALAQQITEKLGVPVVFEDERYTSVIAGHALQQQGVKPSRQKHLVDQTAAALILQQYLDKKAYQA